MAQRQLVRVLGRRAQLGPSTQPCSHAASSAPGRIGGHQVSFDAAPYSLCSSVRHQASPWMASSCCVQQVGAPQPTTRPRVSTARRLRMRMSRLMRSRGHPHVEGRPTHCVAPSPRRSHKWHTARWPATCKDQRRSFVHVPLHSRLLHFDAASAVAGVAEAAGVSGSVNTSGW